MAARVSSANEPKREPVAVGPTSTELVSPFLCRAIGPHPSLTVEVTNTDGTQVLDAWLETSAVSTGPWSIQGTSELRQVQPGESRNPPLDMAGLLWVRVVGTASGAGLTANVAAWPGVVR